MSSHRLPCVSIALPVFNSESTVAAAIQSIVNQTFSGWELLLLDDGSTDRSVEIARSFNDPRIRVLVDGVHRGLPAQLNHAISLSTGELFARMDGDDVAYPERLALQVEYLDRHAHIDLLGGGVLVFGRSGQALGTRKSSASHGQICGRPWAGFPLAHPTWMGRIGWFREHPYHLPPGRCCDQDLLLRTYRCSCFAALPEIVLGYREERLSLRTILGDRFSFGRSLLDESLERGNHLVAARGVLGQGAKGLVDVSAVLTGLNYRVLRHRTLPVNEATVRRWKQVWEQVQPQHPAARALRMAGSGRS
jgi:glycosyltransferase involved in cell wall biosynthesis